MPSFRAGVPMGKAMQGLRHLPDPRNSGVVADAVFPLGLVLPK
jgi:hypothetical protein